MDIDHRSSTTPRNPTLDAVRGIAITLVVLYHLPGNPVQAGLIGVDLFMVVSGFLVTKNLISKPLDWTQVCDFWRRRARRVVVPALVLVLSVLVVRAFAWRLSPRDDYWDAASAIGFVANWRLVVSGADYFRSISGLSPFQHLWSLSVEEQFYFAWPLLVFLVKKRLRETVIVLIALSFMLMAVLAHTNSFSRAYFGTDTRAGTLLIGALLAICASQFSSSRFTSSNINFDLSVALFVLLAFVVSGTSRFMYLGGFFVIALVAAGIVACASDAPHGRNTLFGSRRLFAALHVIGVRSFSIYLVHWPIFVMFSSSRFSTHKGIEVFLSLVTTAVCAEVLYRCVEVSWTRRFGYQRLVFVKLMSATTVSISALVAIGAVSNSLPSFLQGGSESKLTTGNARKVLLVGDSVVQSFVDLGVTQMPTKTALDYVAISGCGLMPGLVADTRNNVYEPSRACEGRVQTDLWGAIAPQSYDLVVWLNAWDAENREFDGSFATQVSQPSVFVEKYGEVTKQLRRFSDQVAIVVLPEKAETSMVDTTIPPKRTRDRYRAAQQNLKTSAQETGASVIDLNNYVCGASSPCRDVSPTGQRFRPIDGIHFSGAGGLEAMRWLQGQIEQLVTN